MFLFVRPRQRLEVLFLLKHIWLQVSAKSGLYVPVGQSNFESSELLLFECTEREHHEKYELSTRLAADTWVKFYIFIQAYESIFLSVTFFHNLISASGAVQHMGCIYSSISSCSYTVRPQFQQNYTRSCQQCNKDGCNSAAQAAGSLFTVVFTIIVTVLGAAVWHKWKCLKRKYIILFWHFNAINCLVSLSIYCLIYMFYFLSK